MLILSVLMSGLQSVLAILVLGAVAFFLKVYFSRRRFFAIRDEVERALRRGARLIDVRPAKEFDKDHLYGAQNLPLAELDKSFHKLGDKHRVIVVYCGNGAKSRSSATALREQGFKSVFDIGSMSNGEDLPFLRQRALGH